jgi:CRISPR-associated endonuclease Cas1
VATIAVADGYSIRVRVKHGRLAISDGSGRQRRERAYSRIGDRPTRLVVIGQAGYVSLEALRWLNDIGAGLIHLDHNLKLVTVSSRLTLDDARLRRLQAKAAETSVGVEIAREIIRRKLAGQAAVLTSLDTAADDLEILEWARRDVEAAATLTEIRTAESGGAVAYWRALSALTVRFGKQDARRVPEHWQSVGKRHSPLTGSSRRAVRPFHALANYLYALLEAEARIACLACGLDPGLGIVHADQRARDSLALDIMEAVRPDIDAYLVNLIRERVFRARDFHETRQGSCRLLAPLTHTLTQTLPTWRGQIAPVAEIVARMLASSPGSRIERSHSPLTQANRRAAHPRLGNRRRRDPSPPEPALPPTCRACGGDLPARERRFCDACLDEERTAAFKLAGPAALAKARAEGKPVNHGGDVARKRGGTVSAQLRATRVWEVENRLPEPGEWDAIQDAIRNVPLNKLVEATGLSLRYVSLIRRGERRPHPRHWEAFATVCPGARQNA